MGSTMTNNYKKYSAAVFKIINKHTDKQK